MIIEAATTLRIPGSLHFPLVTRLATIALTLTVCACRHGALAPATPRASDAPPIGTRIAAADRRAVLQRDIDAALSRPELARSYWGVVVQSLQTGETLYALNARKLMMPASNMKIVTLAAAAQKLGWDYTYETTVRAAGAIENGVLQGDVVIVGSGDPSLMTADRWSATAERGEARRSGSAGHGTICPTGSPRPWERCSSTKMRFGSSSRRDQRKGHRPRSR
jgi:D-alanyl-D-alanine carboxypeptidase